MLWHCSNCRDTIGIFFTSVENGLDFFSREEIKPSSYVIRAWQCFKFDMSLSKGNWDFSVTKTVSIPSHEVSLCEQCKENMW